MLYYKNKNYVLCLLVLLVIPLGVSVSYYPRATLAGALAIFITVIIMTRMVSQRDQTLSKLINLLMMNLFLIPGINISGISFRLDDYIAIFLTIGLFLLLVNNKYKNAGQLLINILFIYLGYSFFITLINIIFNDLNLILILYFIKEIQYFIYFFVIYYLAKNHENFQNNFKKYFLISALITIGWGIIQLVTGNIIGYYGIGIISVSAPSQSGIVLFLISLFLFYMSLIEKNKIKTYFLTVASLASIALTFATISRTAISVLLGIILLYLFISLFRRWNFKKILIGLYFFILVSPVGIILIGDELGYSIIERFSRFSQGASGRMGFWQGFLSHSNNLGLIFGNGKGFMQEIVGTFTLKADSQYVRLILEVGIIGLIFWILLIVSILLFATKHLRTHYYDSLFLILLTISFIVVGITQEGYLVTIQGSLYWILTGYFIGNITRKKTMNNYRLYSDN